MYVMNRDYLNNFWSDPEGTLKGRPSFNQSIVGAGLPVVLHSIFTTFPSMAIKSVGTIFTFGGSVKTQMKYL